MPKSFMKCRMRPDWKNIMGTNTHMVVLVAASTAMPTCDAPDTAASRHDRCFSSRIRNTFSSTTTAGSTSMPSDSMSPESETMLIVIVESKSRMAKNIRPSANITLSGIATLTIIVLRTLRMKKYRITTTSTPPVRPAFRKLVRLLRMSFDRSRKTYTWMPAMLGSRFSPSNSSLTRRHTATKFAEEDFLTSTFTASRPSSNWYDCFLGKSYRTSATSPRRTIPLRRGRRSRSSGLASSPRARTTYLRPPSVT